MSRDESKPYLTGNGLARRCLHYFPWQDTNPPALGLNRAAETDNDFVYVKADFIHAFFASKTVPLRFSLLTHNSDVAIGEEHLRHLGDPRLRIWFAQNVAIEHPKLKALPIGIANANYPHGNTVTLDAVRAERRPKTRLLHASFSVGTDTDGSRARCLAATKVAPDPPKPFGDYLRDLAESCFCLSPRGRGIDCHRTWEALYVGAIPIVEKSPLWRDHADLPHIALDRWEDFQKLDLTPALYKKLWGRFDAAALHIDAYCGRLRTKYGVNL